MKRTASKWPANVFNTEQGHASDPKILFRLWQRNYDCGGKRISTDYMCEQMARQQRMITPKARCGTEKGMTTINNFHRIHGMSSFTTISETTPKECFRWMSGYLHGCVSTYFKYWNNVVAPLIMAAVWSVFAQLFIYFSVVYWLLLSD